MRAMRFILVVIILCCSIIHTTGITVQRNIELRVMSFNIRYGTAKDGENHWDKRKELLIERIKAFNPDLLGTQETLGFQRDYIALNLPGYDVLGVGRDDGAEKGEMAALYFKRSRFEKLDGGHFWLSETPDKPGSKSWDAALTRMVTWVKLRDLQNKNAKPIMYFNTHFDHLGEQARLESAKLLRRRITEQSKDCSVIVTGDFNAGEDSAPYKAFFGVDQNTPSPVRDTYRVIYPGRAANEGTFTGFKPESTNGDRIDWIGVSREWKVTKAVIDRTSKDGHLPSDHFPVMAVLQLQNSKR